MLIYPIANPGDVQKRGVFSMKTLSVFFVLFFSLLSPSFTEAGELSGFGQLWTAVSPSGDTNPVVNLFLEKKLFDPLGLFFFSATNEKYGKAYGGVRLYPTEWLSLGVGGGRETSADPWRIAALVATKHSPLFFNATFEIGGSGIWASGNARVQINRFSLGSMYDRPLGVGPYGDVRVGPLTFWTGVPLWNPESEKWTGGAVGLRLSLR